MGKAAQSEKKEERPNGEKREGEADQLEEGKEERREGEKRRREGRNGFSPTRIPARPATSNRRVFAISVQISDELSQGTTPNHHLGLPSLRFTPRIIEFRCDFAKNTPTGAATLLFKFSKF